MGLGLGLPAAITITGYGIAHKEHGKSDGEKRRQGRCRSVCNAGYRGDDDDVEAPREARLVEERKAAKTDQKKGKTRGKGVGTKESTTKRQEHGVPKAGESIEIVPLSKGTAKITVVF